MEEKHLCKYGCGQEGKFEGKGHYNKGTYRCAKSPNSCPSLKQKNKENQPYTDVVKKKEIVDKIIKTKKDNFGEDYLSIIGNKTKEQRLLNNPNTYFDHLVKMQETCLNKYGVINPYSQENVQSKRKQTNLEKYGNEIVFSSEKFKLERFEKLIIKRIEELRVRYSSTIFDNSIVDKELYGKICRKLTGVSKRLFFKYDSSTHQLDHKFSVCSGYLNKISPFVICHPANLEILTKYENLSKKEKCSIEIEHLIESFNNSSFRF